MLNYRTALAALALTIPTAAMAQTVTTSCHTKKHGTYCRSTVTPGLGASLDRLVGLYQERQSEKITREGERLIAEQVAQKAAADRNPATQDPDFQTWRMGQFFTSADCPGARRYAVETKRADLIGRAAAFCAPAAP